jgi:hypothetical protein
MISADCVATVYEVQMNIPPLLPNLSDYYSLSVAVFRTDEGTYDRCPDPEGDACCDWVY